VVAAKPGATLERARVLSLFEGRLARFKHPKDVIVVDALPRTALGKVSKEDVRQMVARLAGAKPGNGEQIACH
jgi:fatty-acyl-CoA synthase